MPDETPTPYASPQEVSQPEHDNSAATTLSEPQRKLLEVGEVVVAWEELRLWCNLILGITLAPFLLILLSYSVTLSGGYRDFAANCIACWLAANIYYSAGPFVEGYWTWLFGPTRWLRIVLLIGVALFIFLRALRYLGHIFQGVM